MQQPISGSHRGVDGQFLEEGVDELSWGTVLSIPAALEVVVPQLADVVAGADG